MGGGQRRRVGGPLHGQGCLAPQVLSTRAPLRSAKRALALELRDFFLGPGPRGLGAAFFLGSPVRLETGEHWGARRPRPGLTPAVRPADATPRGRLFCGDPAQGPGCPAPSCRIAEMLVIFAVARLRGPSPVRALPSPAPPPLSLGRAAGPSRRRSPGGARGWLRVSRAAPGRRE